MGNIIILFTAKCLFFCFVYFWFVYFFAHQLLDSLFIFFHCFFFLFYSYASIINLCGSFVFSKFVELF
ncbi:hypothetical protein NC653_039971 [Populus alba x Populus x berolinensis]|uniref:Uncharacterized protein n=1 Tax=Populus alba x Populus x berolinensis TaxID=444605 RepID=A0AAD6PR33_9ROSI|nr:hypothetical protein NC653_039971 [Populus alba x Populus x berolinensis]